MKTKPRRKLEGTGYLESNRDYMENNADACIRYLDAATDTGGPFEADIKHFFLLARKIALRWVENEARHIMREHTRCNEFIMGMGSWLFRDPSGIGIYELPRYMVNMHDFMERWDSIFKLTGESMRFTAGGPVKTEW